MQYFRLLIIKKDLINKCQIAAKEMRKDVIKMTYNVGTTGAHIGGSLSMIEIIATLFICVMRYDIQNTRWEERDRFILSKGHGVMAQYTAMKQIGKITDEDLTTFKKNETVLHAHPSMNMELGIEFSSGSLGQGLSLGVGTALALKIKSNNISRVFVLIGDGECDEGSIWEAAASAAHYELNNIVAIIDKNGLQYDGNTENVLNMNNLEDKWRSFGWEVYIVNGHNIEALLSVLTRRTDKPIAVIADTVKGKGVSFMENNPIWHNGRLTDQQYQQAMDEQEGTI